MKSCRFALASAAIVATLVIASSADAVTTTHTMYITFGQPVSLPGMSLPAGTYTFEIPSETSPDVVRVSSRDRQRVFLTALTQTVTRSASHSNGASIVLGEARHGEAPQVRIWYPEGTNIGHAFLY
jgi:hypothetical protein